LSIVQNLGQRRSVWEVDHATITKEATMWVQLDREQIERLLVLAHDNELPDVAEKLQNYLDLEAKESPSTRQYLQAAKQLYGREGELEFDDDTVVSGGVGEGAYVMAWRWIEDSDLKRTRRRQYVKLEC
jgi:hypothetical protein